MWFFIKYLLYPISLIYGFITSLRNFLYDYQILSSKKYNIKIISVGNIIMGGAGKTPMVEYLSKYFLKKNISFSILSRGYKRLTEGLRKVVDSDTYLTVGDEPKQLYNKFGNYSNIFVSENRHNAIKLIEKQNHSEYIILDDAFQNRSITTDFNIVLSSYYTPFFDDYVFPFGMLREYKSNVKRADVLIFTNSPNNLLEKDSEIFKNNSFKYLNKKIPILFSYVKYIKPVNLFNKSFNIKNVLLSTSIANASHFNAYMRSKFNVLKSFEFKDHHRYSKNDVLKLIKYLDNSTALFVTEKDAVKLCEFKDLFSDYSVYYVPIEVRFLYNKELSDFI